MKTKKIFTIFIFVAIVTLLIAIKTKAATTDNVTGWAWGGSTDSAGIPTGLGWISMNNTNVGGGISYGVNVPSTDGLINGNAWSENLGWISFNAADLNSCPISPCNAQRSGNDIVGWARILSISQAGINAGGYNGWIHLSGLTQNSLPYGIKIDPSTGFFSGMAYSMDFGVIDFSKVKIGPAAPSISLNLNVVNQGRVVSDPAGLDCVGICSHTFPQNTSVTLTASAGTLLSWSGGGCSGNTATCVVTTDSEKTVIATFAPVCGNGFKESTEECDDGSKNGACPQLCSSSCTINTCSSSVKVTNWREVAL